MGLLSEFRNPTRWYSKVVAALLVLAFCFLVVAGLTAGYVLYNIVRVLPAGSNDAVGLASFPGHPENIVFEVEGVGMREGWFFPGLKLAPTIVLCPGYQVNRGELLPLATALQDHQYNVFLFGFDNYGSSAGSSTLGFREVRELRAAISMLARRVDVDRSRFGLWGANMGGYAALAAAESDPRVRALVVESVYDHPQEMVRIVAARNGLASLSVIRRLTEKGFYYLNYRSRETPPLSARLTALAGVSKLFLATADEPELIDATRRLFTLAPEPKEEAMLSRGNYAGMLGDEKQNYENRMVSFFLLNFPP